MVYLTKEETNKIVKKLSNNSDKELKGIIKKLKSPEKRKIYVRDKDKIKRLIQKAFNKKRKIKIGYYSPNNDEKTTRIVDIYKVYKEVITTFCHLRKEERNFVINRINSATILNDKYEIPKNWIPKSIILDK